MIVNKPLLAHYLLRKWRIQFGFTYLGFNSQHSSRISYSKSGPGLLMTTTFTPAHEYGRNFCESEAFFPFIWTFVTFLRDELSWQYQCNPFHVLYWYLLTSDCGLWTYLDSSEGFFVKTLSVRVDTTFLSAGLLTAWFYKAWYPSFCLCVCLCHRLHSTGDVRVFQSFSGEG